MPSFGKKRDTIAFHVDRDVIDGGLDELVKDRAEVFLSQGDAGHADATSLTLGFHALVNSTGMDLNQYGKFVARVSGDHGIGEAIQLAFIRAVEAPGIPFGDREENSLVNRSPQ